MQEQIKLEDITDINTLKSYKSDNYDLIEQAKVQIETSSHNINALNGRIAQLQNEVQPVETEEK
jgi:hypothetical protein